MRVLYASAKFTDRRRAAFPILLVLVPGLAVVSACFPGHSVILASGNNNETSHRPTRRGPF